MFAKNRKIWTFLKSTKIAMNNIKDLKFIPEVKRVLLARTSLSLALTVRLV